jgi:putative heme-binding domain-containing protein
MNRFVFMLAVFACSQVAFAQNSITVPEGFKITKVAEDSLATNIYTLTVDGNGHPVVAGPGYIKRLIDKNRDGIYDDYQLMSNLPRNGAQGLCFDGTTLYAVGDQGVLRLPDKDGDGVCEKPEVVYEVKTGGEHDAHAIRKGPNGQWYLLCGNGVPKPSENFLKGSQRLLSKRQSMAGYLLEFENGFARGSVKRLGFRNPYDFDFNSDGEIFTYDSDGERDFSLPWYRPTRVYRLNENSDAGWISASWKHPHYAPTMPETIGRHGRGSPSGVVCYRGQQFPEDFVDAVFVLDWTVGRILVHKRDQRTGNYDAGEVFVKANGSRAFAVTDCEIAGDGSMLVSVGGRGTEGAVYRIESTTKASPRPPLPAKSKTSTQAQSETSNHLALYVLSNAQRQMDLLLRKAIQHRREADSNWPAVFDGYAGGKIGFGTAKLSLEAIYPAMKLARGIAFYEWCRLLAHDRVSTPEIRTLILNQISMESDPVDDIHYLLCLARCCTKPSITEVRKMVNALLLVRPKLERNNANTDRNWPLRMRELASVLVREFQVGEMISNHPQIALPENFYLIEVLSKPDQEIVKMQIADAILQDPGLASPQQIGFLANARSNIYCGLIRAYAGESHLVDAVIRSLARSPIQEDRETFVKGLQSLNRDTWRLSAIGLRKLKTQRPIDAIRVFQNAAKLGDERSDQRVKDELKRFLVERFRDDENVDQEFTLAEWKAYLAKQFPDEMSAVLKAAETKQELVERLMKVDLAGGDVARGRTVFQKLLCAKCHDGGNRLGPSLKGLTSRFSNRDIFNAIVDPGQQIPARYRALKILTVDGETHYGAVVYESAEGVVMSDQRGNPVRVGQDDIELRSTSSVSLMPAGLLDEASDAEVKDLMSYMKSLK